VRLVGSKTAPKGMGNMHHLMDEYLGLLLFAQHIESFRNNLDDIMGFTVQGELHDSGKAMTPGNNSSAVGSLASYTGHPEWIDMVHGKVLKDLSDLPCDILCQFIPNHRTQITIIEL
jgi:hypothetical protein